MRPAREPTSPSGFTLIEMLIVVAVLGIAGALVIPSMGSVHVLRVQTSIRTVVSDLTFAQADAIAFQEKRAVVFDLPNNTYSVVSVPGSTIDLNNRLFYPGGPGGRYTVDLNAPQFGGAAIHGVNFDTQPYVIFDDLGTPVRSLTDDRPGLGGSVFISGSSQLWQVVVEAYTGRVTVRRVGG
jgi:prepilin-type N-terminal cleavage/methylation domain-containing protein